MSWITFSLWLCGTYSIYYIVLILFDFLHRKQSPADSNEYELTFTEQITPVQASVTERPESAIVESGGINRKQIFNLVREESIQYTRSVSF